MQLVVSTAGHPLHLHGYQTAVAGLPTVPQLGGHVGSASAISVTATVWPLSQVITRSGELHLEALHTGAFRRAIQAHFADPTQFHDPHGLMTLGLLREELVAGFGQEQVNNWLKHAMAEACLVKTDDGWAGAHVLQPGLPALPSCGAEPSIHFTVELILAIPVELMVKHQAADGWFDIHNNPSIGAQAHGVRALGATLPLLEAQAAEGELR
ncbi:MAG: hypothetical protein ACE5I2_09645 [Anaerolineae bacterium]